MTGTGTNDPLSPPVGPCDRVNILLVDDQPGKLLAHESILTELGQNVVKAGSGREALECLLRQDFAVILLDVNMPDMDGFETAELIRQRPRFEKTPIIFLTAFNTSDIDHLKGYSLGAVDYMFLPVVPEILKAKVSAFVELARQNALVKRQAEHLAFHNLEQARKLELIERLNQELREANEQLEAFSYSVSHDLRAPLRAMQGFSRILLDEYGPQLDDFGRNYLQRISCAALQMDQLTLDLLAYSRIGKGDLRPQRVALDQLLNEVLSNESLFDSTAAEIIIEPGLIPVMATPALLSQCLVNLLNNAVKFIEPGVKPRVRVWTERRAAGDGVLSGTDKVRIWVEDNGVGIDPVHHEKVFGIFERVGKVKREGSGIGLAIVARAVQRMSGKYGLESALGAGSRFWIELDAAE